MWNLINLACNQQIAVAAKVTVWQIVWTLKTTRFDVHSFPAAPNFRRVMKARLARSTWDHLCAVVPSGNIREPVRSHYSVNSPAERATAPRMMAGKAMNRQPKEATKESCWAPADVRADSTRWKYACKETWCRHMGQYLRNPTIVVKLSLFLVLCGVTSLAETENVEDFGDLHEHRNIVNESATVHIKTSVDSRFAPSQWETTLRCNDVSHLLGTNLESALKT